MSAPANIAKPTGLYFNDLPPRKQSLAELAELAILSSLNLAIVPDAHWNAANDRAFDDREAFRERFFAQTGLTAETLDGLIRGGVL